MLRAGPPKRHTLVNTIAPELARHSDPLRERSDVNSSLMISQPLAMDIGELNVDCTQLAGHFDGPSMVESETENYL